jgi:hypothetical protein
MKIGTRPSTLRCFLMCLITPRAASQNAGFPDNLQKRATRGLATAFPGAVSHSLGDTTKSLGLGSSQQASRTKVVVMGILKSRFLTKRDIMSRPVVEDRGCTLVFGKETVLAA